MVVQSIYPELGFALYPTYINRSTGERRRLQPGGGADRWEITDNGLDLLVLSEQQIAPGGAAIRASLYKMSVATGAVTRLSDGSFEPQGWSDDGSALVERTVDPVTQVASLVLRRSGSAPVNLLSTVPVGFRSLTFSMFNPVALSHTGRFVVFTAASPACSTCTSAWRFDAATGLSTLASVDADGELFNGQIRAISVSGDGSTAAILRRSQEFDEFIEYPNESIALYVRDFDRQSTQLIDLWVQDPPKLSTNGDRLAYRAALGRMWVLDLRTGAIDLIGQGVAGRLPIIPVTSLAFTSNGRSLLFATNWLPTDTPGSGTNPFSNVFESTLPAVMPTPAYVALAPQRLFDTRPTGQTVDGVSRGRGAALPFAPVSFQPLGRGGMPYVASAVVVNVTITDAESNGFATVYPCRGDNDLASAPYASSVNFQRGATRANQVVMAIDLDYPFICVMSSAKAQVIADVSGYFPLGAELVSTVPFRVVDTRAGGWTFDGKYQAGGELLPGQRVVFKVPFAQAGEAVVLNLTSTGSQANGYLTAWPCDQTAPPNASNVNFVPGQDVANLAIVAVNDSGEVCVEASAPTHLLIDVSGYLWASSGYQPASPRRLLDTRAPELTVDGRFSGGGVRQGGSRLELTVSGRGGVPPNARAVVLNITATATGGAGYLTVWPCDSPTVPNSSTLNFLKGQTVPNVVVAPLSPQGTICLQTSEASAHLIADLNGWFDSSSLVQRSDADYANRNETDRPLIPLG